MESVLIAIGGNALYDKQSGNNLSPEMVTSVCQRIVEIYRRGYLPVITFGNGPQVGNLLDMAETSARLFETPVKLDTCVAWTQGEIGYWLTRELKRQFLAEGVNRSVMAVNTLVEVDPNDIAFLKPSKPVGKFIDADEAQKLYEDRGWIVGPDANRGYRRMVPSPKPLSIVETEPIRQLIASQCIVLCCGGGGIPVYQKEGVFQGIEAVIDKDFTSCLLAKTLHIENLLICTEVENVCLNFGKPNEKALYRISLTEAEQYQAEGHFAAGSMGPKISAMIDYVRHGGKRAFITNLEKAVEALDGHAGTEISISP